MTWPGGLAAFSAATRVFRVEAQAGLARVLVGAGGKAKQVSVEIGRTSRLKSILSGSPQRRARRSVRGLKRHQTTATRNDDAR